MAMHVHQSLKSRPACNALCIADTAEGGDQPKRQSMQAGQEAYGQQGCPEPGWFSGQRKQGVQEQMNRWGLAGGGEGGARRICAVD